MTKTKFQITFEIMTRFLRGQVIESNFLNSNLNQTPTFCQIYVKILYPLIVLTYVKYVQTLTSSK